VLAWPQIMRVPFASGLLCALGLSAWLLGCGGPSYESNVYRGEGVAFRTGGLPASWRAIEVDGALLAFRNDADNATVAVNGRCGVEGDDVPLPVLTNHLFLLFTDRKLGPQRALQLDGRDALRTEMTAHLDGVPKQFVVYVLKKDSCVYDFMWIGALDAPAASLQAFERFVGGFSTQL